MSPKFDLPFNPARPGPNPLRRFIVACACLALLLPAASAQRAANPKSAEAIARAAARDAARAADFEAALAAAARGNLAHAESRIARASMHQPNTLLGALESASRLGHLALSLRQRGHHEASESVALRALATLTAIAPAELAQATSQARAQVWQSVGLIYERMLFDEVAAKAAYLKAQQEHADAPGAQAGLKRLEEALKQRGETSTTKA